MGIINQIIVNFCLSVKERTPFSGGREKLKKKGKKSGNMLNDIFFFTDLRERRPVMSKLKILFRDWASLLVALYTLNSFRLSI